MGLPGPWELLLRGLRLDPGHVATITVLQLVFSYVVVLRAQLDNIVIANRTLAAADASAILNIRPILGAPPANNIAIDKFCTDYPNVIAYNASTLCTILRTF